MSSSSSQTATTTDTTTSDLTTNNQVGTSGGGAALGAYSTGNDINISTTDSQDLLTSATLAGDATIAGDATAVAGVNAGAGLGIAAIGANLDATQAALDSSNETVNTALQSIDYNNGLNANVTSQALNTVSQTQANQDALLDSLTSNFTGALEQTSMAGLQLASGATNQALQIAANAAPQTQAAAQEHIAGGTGPVSTTSYGVGGLSGSSSTVLLIAAAAVALILILKK